jgi:hypothetical protein
MPAENAETTENNEQKQMCCDCKEEISESDDTYTSHTMEDILCYSCWASDSETAATVHLVKQGKVDRFYVGKHLRMTEHGDEIGWNRQHKNLQFTNKWVKTSEWRGYSETKIVGWSLVAEGWTTGGWDDEVARKKQVFNQWVNDILKGELTPPTSVAIITEPTSNVFSAAASIFVPEQEVKEFHKWMETQETTVSDLCESLS